jgi:hypothetical protein
MLIELKTDFFLNTAYIISVEIVTNEPDSFSVIVKSSSSNQGNKGPINIDFDDYKSAKALIDKIKKALK